MLRGTVCTAPIPATASSARIGEVQLRLPPRQIQKIAIIGDTGCRLKAANCPAPVAGCRADCVADDIQACNDPAAWPFATVAEMAARSGPDLVIHVGDYSYREARCPPGTASHYTRPFQELNALASRANVPSWLLSHHPLWAFLINSEGQLLKPTEPLQQALHPNDLDPKIKFTVAGHIHLFEALGFTQEPGFWRPPGAVFGMGGTALDAPVPENLVGKEIDFGTVNAAVTKSRFGYALAERDGSEDRWKLTAYSPKGKLLVVCSFEGMALNCQVPPGP